MDDDWSLSTEQLAFMQRYHDTIMAAYEAGSNGDDDGFRRPLNMLIADADYQRAFGAMSWDEAFDRYECWLDGGE